MNAQRQRLTDTAAGIALALCVIGAWLAVHITAIFAVDWSRTPLVVALAVIAVQTWLSVGLFIVAHDCMHGSLAPGRPAVNRWFGRVALALYAAFSYDRLLPKHHRHHKRPGTADDPDFCPDAPTAFLPWFIRFFLNYYGWREFAAMSVAVAVYMALTGAAFAPFLVFYALPAILSAVQLFYFGTYRPHRVDEDDPFHDRHNARTDGFPVWLSLLTCFHFGYHHEHHVTPGVPWWRLPQAHRAATRGDTGGAGLAAR